MESDVPPRPPGTESGTARGVVRRMLQVAAQYVVLAATMFVASGRPSWVWAWAVLGVGLAILAVNAAILPAELIAERGRPRENVKRWDKVLAAVIHIPFLGVPIVAGLDQRFGWSAEMAPALHLGGLAGIALGQGLFSWAMASNRFFSTLVRIQADRGHTVATGGPYRYVRHPGYVGMVVSLLGTTLALGSAWAILPAGLAACLLVVRTALEDRTLQEELPGYRDYARLVRHRLLPGIW